MDQLLLEKITAKKVLTVLNKSDLSEIFDQEHLPENLLPAIKISALTGDGSTELIKKLHQHLGVSDFDLALPVCFTDRQEDFVKQLITVKSSRLPSLDL